MKKSVPISLTSTQSQHVRRRVLCVAIAQAVFGLSAVHAASIDVNSASDTSSQQDCILRDAIISANTDQATGGCAAGSGTDTITFDGLTTPATILLSNGVLTISTPMALQGPGRDQLTIDAGGLSQVLTLNNGDFNSNIDVAIDGLTFTNGYSSSPNGAGISVAHENLLLSNSTISNSTGNEGGGGLYAGDRATVTIRGTEITGNTATYGGGGIDSRGVAKVYDSNVSNNFLISGSGAGINAGDGQLSLVRTTITGNTAQGTNRNAGGLSCRFSEVDIIDSQISSNSAPTGGGIAAGQACTLSLTNSTLATNTATATGLTDRGGAIRANSNGQAGDNRFTLTLSNSTISGNSANRIGGIYASGGVLYLNQVTIANNSAVEGNAPLPPYGLVGPVGGLQVDANFHVSNSIIANNTGADCNDVFEPLASNVNNLIGDGTCSPGSSGDPVLGPLQNNGGPTPTHNLLAGSPAFGAGDPNFCPPTDQRGAKRPDGSYCDLGAVENAIVVNTLADGVVDDGLCSLREAAWAAFSNSEYFGCAAGSADVDDSILFVEDILPGTIILTDGVITFQGSVHVLGPGSDRLTVSGNNTNRIFWISDSDSGTIQNVSIKGLTLSSGASSLGGGIRNDDSLSVESCVFSGNVGTNGAAIFTAGPLSIDDSVFIGNTAGYSSIISVSLESSATITNSVISGNSGTGISAGGSLNVHRASISNNDNGGVVSFGTVNVTESFIFDNSSYSGAGLRAGGSGNLFIENSTVSGNTASPGFGGGVANEGAGTVTVTNSTISGNSATRGGGGISNTSYEAGFVNLLNSTLFNNTQQNEGGGGLLSKYGGTVSMINTVIANSVGSNDCALLSGVFSAHTNNLVEDGSCNDAGAVNFLSGDPLLGPLQANGGFTQTHAILPGSPLIDAGNATACAGYPADQRGVGRPQDGNDDWVATCDIGSFELSGNFLFRNGFEAGGN